MGEERNVLLTVVQQNNEEKNDEIVIDFGAIWKYVKRLFIFWLCFAVGSAALSGSAALLLQNSRLQRESRALISVPDAFLKDGYDINKLKSAAVIGDALNAMDIGGERVESFQNAVNIQGVIPDAVHERMSMYYNLISASMPDTSVVDSLLNTDYQASQYVVSFRYSSVGMEQEQGIVFLNELLRAYQDYCALNYNYNAPLNVPLNAVDYHDYDYAEAVDIFSRTLDNISDYLARMNQGAGASFRSTQTGFTFQDLSRVASLLKDIDLDRISSYVVIHSVSTYDTETEISYYEWMIENLTRQRAIERTRYSSLTNSIDAYEKDSLVIFSGQNGNALTSSSEDINANYDAMITEKLSSQATIASYTRSINYYESVIEGFRNAGDSSNPEDVEQVNQYLDSLNEAVNRLIRNISLTANEYYETVAFSNQARTLVPATFDGAPLITGLTVKLVAAGQLLVFAFYIGAASILGIRESNARKKEEQKAPL